MLEYLIQYGFKRTDMGFSDLDITDKTRLESQINDVRRNIHDMLLLSDDIQARLLAVNAKMSERSRELLSSTTTRANIVLACDSVYCAFEAERDALKAGATMVNAQVNSLQADLKILQSALYNKF